MNQPFEFTDPNEALNALANLIATVDETEHVPIGLGRVLGAKIVADRDSPAANVSAMDGYAIKLENLQSEHEVPISDTCQAGAAPPSMLPGHVVRIFTGAIVPAGADAIVKREETVELERSIRFLDSALSSTVAGSHIRNQGENAIRGSDVLDSGALITPAVIASLSNFGSVEPRVFRKVRVSVVTTGDEVVEPEQQDLEPWQLRNSNRSVVSAMLVGFPFVETTDLVHVADNRQELSHRFEQAIERSDVVVLTGGVSKGDYDFVPEMIASVGARIVFHGLPIRPGKPILAAVTDRGKLILGLPGNPVSATVNSHRFLVPLLRRMAGIEDWKLHPEMVCLTDSPAKPIPLHTMLLAELIRPGTARLIKTMGSGDLVALARSDGYVMVPPSESSIGPWPMYRWSR